MPFGCEGAALYNTRSPETFVFVHSKCQEKNKAFGVVSKKTTLGEYVDKIEGKYKHQDYYNKCAHYLLELVGKSCKRYEISGEEIEIVFEKKDNHDYGRLQSYLRRINRSPIHARAAFLQYLDPLIISAKSKDEEFFLFLADLVAYSLFRAFYPDGNRLKISEQRYLRELVPIIERCPNSHMIAGSGIKFIRGPTTIGLDAREYQFAMKFYRKKTSG